MDGSQPTRREVLRGAAGIAAVVGLAGCQTGPPPSLEPELPSDRLTETGWRLTEDLEVENTEEVEIGGTTQRVQIEAKADVYENHEPLGQLADRLGIDPDGFDLPPEAFIAAKARTDPPVTRLLSFSDGVLSRALDTAEGEAKRTLRGEGLTDIRRVEEGRLDIRTGATAVFRRYLADYSYESTEVTYQGRQVTVEPGTFTLEFQLAVWPYRGLVASGGGIYPGEPGHITVSAQGRSRELSLGFEPSRSRSDVQELITLIS